MTSKPINPQPIQMPDLSTLPDPFKNLMGESMTSPATLMQMNTNEVTNLMGTKLMQPMEIKPSGQAERILKDLQSQRDNTNRIAQEQYEKAERERLAQIELATKARQEQVKLNNQLLKEREKALEKKAKEQGGKLGLASDGGFLADQFVRNVTTDEGWIGIKSSLERADVGEHAVKNDFETYLRSITNDEEKIQAELEQARAGIKASVKLYEREMRKNGWDVTDLATATAKTATTLGAYASMGGSMTAMGKLTDWLSQKMLGKSISDETTNFLLDARDAIDKTYSPELQLNRANHQYTMAKAEREAGGDLGIIKGTTTTIKSLWDNDQGLMMATEMLPDLIGSAGAGFAGKLLLKGGGKLATSVGGQAVANSTKLQTLSRIANGTMQTNSKLANFALRGLSVPVLAGAGYGTYSTMAQTAADTYDTVRDTPTETIAKHYGAEAWNALVTEHGEQEARNIVANQTARDAARNISHVVLLSSMYGLDGMVGGLVTRVGAKEVAEKIKLSTGKTALNFMGGVAAGSATEAFEEGYTQYGSNVALNRVTGANPMDGVTEAAVSGAYMGAMLGGAVKATDMVMTARTLNSLNNISTDGGFSANADGTTTFNTEAYRKAFGEAMSAVAHANRAGDGSYADHKTAKQFYYDTVFDNDARYQQFATPEQKAEFKTYAREAHGINTNDYAFHDPNETTTAYESSDLERVKSTGNEVLLDAFRLKHGVETEAVAPENLQVTKALVRSIDFVNTLDPNLNTLQRATEFQKFIETDLENDSSLDEQDRAGIAQFMNTHYGTLARRMTDQEQATYNDEVQKYQATQQENRASSVSGTTETDDGTSTQQDGGQPTEVVSTEMGQSEQSVSPQPNSQSVGNAGTRQTSDTSLATGVSAQSSQTDGGLNAGTTTVQGTGVESNPATPQTNRGTPTQNGDIGQTNQGGQPVGQTNTPATQTPTGSRGVGTPPSERNSDGGGNQTIAQAKSTAVRDGVVGVTDGELSYALKIVTKSLKGANLTHTFNISDVKEAKRELNRWVTVTQDTFETNDNFVPRSHTKNVEGKRKGNSIIRATAIYAIIDKRAITQHGGKKLASKLKTATPTADNSSVATPTTPDNGGWDFVDETEQAIDPLSNQDLDLDNVTGVMAEAEAQIAADERSRQEAEQATAQARARDEEARATDERITEIGREWERLSEPTEVEKWFNDFFGADSEYGSLSLDDQLYVLDSVEQFIDETDPDMPIVDDIGRISNLYLNISDVVASQEIDNTFDNLEQALSQLEPRSVQDYDNVLLELGDVVGEMYPRQANQLLDWIVDNEQSLYMDYTNNDTALLTKLAEVAFELEQGRLYEDYQDAWALARNVANADQRVALDELISAMGSQGVPMSTRIESLLEFANQARTAQVDEQQRIDELVANYPFTQGTLPLDGFIDAMMVNPPPAETVRNINDPKYHRKYDPKKAKKLVAKQNTKLTTYIRDSLPVRLTKRGGTSVIGAIKEIRNGRVVFRPDDGSTKDVNVVVGDMPKLNVTLGSLNKIQSAYTFEIAPYAYTQSDFIRGVKHEPTRQTPQTNAKSVKLPSKKRAGETKTPSRSTQNQEPVREFSKTLNTLLGRMRKADYKSEVKVTNAIQNLADKSGLSFTQLTNQFVQVLQNPITFPYTQAQIDSILASLDDEAERRAIPSSRVRRTPTVTETTNANEQNQTQTEPSGSSPTADANTTQDGAGASGLSSDTQTTASQTETVTPQEQSNATQDDLANSQQPTTDRTNDENSQDIVGGVRTSDEQSGEVSAQSGQPVSEQSQESGTETTQDTEQLGVARLENRVSDKRLNTAFGNLSPTDKAVLNPNGLKPAELRADLHDKLTRPTPELSAEQNTALDNLVNKIRGVKTSATDSPAKNQASQQSVDVIDKVFNRDPDLVARAEEEFDKLNLDTNLSDFVRVVLGSDFASKDVYDVLGNPSKYKGRYENVTKDNSTDVLNSINLDNAKKEYNALGKGQGGAVTLDFLLALPRAVLSLMSAVWNAIKNNFAKVSLAVALATGTTVAIPTEANGATPTETAVVQNIIRQNDNQGKQFIVADKQAGTMTVYSPAGVELVSTPALFGKDTGDTISGKNTPSGRFETKQANVRTEGYGGSAQVLTQNGQNLQLGGSPYAIHRVYTKYASENRQGRLDTSTATDNRISHGCINVPVDFYDTYLNSDQDTVVYVMPETDAGRTGVFNTLGSSDLNNRTTSSADGFADAKTQTISMTPSEVQTAVSKPPAPTNGTTNQVVVLPNVASTSQVAVISSLPVSDVTATRMAVAQGQHTPAEQKANDKFDTEPVKETYDGVSLNDIAVALEMALGGLGAGVVLTANRRRKRNENTTPEPDTTPEQPVNTPEQPVNTPEPNTQPVAQDTLDNDGIDWSDEVQALENVNVLDDMDSIYDTYTPPDDVLLTAEEQLAIDEALGMMELETNRAIDDLQEYTEKVLRGELTVQPKKLATKRTAISQSIRPPRTAPQMAIDRALLIRTLSKNPQITQEWIAYGDVVSDILERQSVIANDHRVSADKARKWYGVSTEKSLGLFAKTLNIIAGATPLFDTQNRNNGIAFVGYEADSSVASVALAGIKMKRSGVFGVISDRHLKPLNNTMRKLSYNTKVSIEQLKEDVGELANARHVLDEGYAYHVKDLEQEIKLYEQAHQEIKDEIAELGEATIDQTLDLSFIEGELAELQTELKLIDDTYHGRIEWDKNKVRLPGGRTKAEWDKIIADAQAKYGDNYAEVVGVTDMLYKGFDEIKKYASSYGVYTNEQLKNINDIGFTKYVPLYKKERSANEMLDSHEDDTVKMSKVARIISRYTSASYTAASIAQAKDLSRFRRQGATSPADNAFNNFELYALNMSGRIAEQAWIDVVQQMHEGTTHVPHSQSRITDPNTLETLNSKPQGAYEGLIRVPVGAEQYLPKELKDRITDPKSGNLVVPVRAKGHDSRGNLVTFNYYFTDRAIRDEIYSNTQLGLDYGGLVGGGLASLTRFQSSLLTRWTPMWNIWNYAQDSLERMSNMLFREVRDRDGNKINRLKVAGRYISSLVKLTNPMLIKQYYDYIVHTKLDTPVQRLLHEAKTNGAISMRTALTARNSALADLKKSEIDRLAEKMKSKLGIIVDSNPITHHGAKLVTAPAEMYASLLVELPQVITALAAYNAYTSLGVGHTETANRVRDQFDPFRSQNELIKLAATVHPFVRSAGAGGYNLMRNLTQYWGKGDKLGTFLTLAGGLAVMYGLQAMAMGAMGEDDDGEPYAKRLSATDLARGLPIHGDNEEVFYFPVGFGLNAMLSSISANIHAMNMGQQGVKESVINILGNVVHNTSPVSVGTGATWAEDTPTAMLLTLSPTIVQPFVELSTNTDAYTGRKIISDSTPPSERDSEQGSANVSEKYKEYAKTLYGFGIDARPETLRHLAENYFTGPLRAVTADINDRAEKTNDREMTKGEYYGTWATALGLDLKRSHTALSDTNLSYKMIGVRNDILKKYNVPLSHKSDDYAEHGVDRHEQGAGALTAVKLEKQGASAEEIRFVVNTLDFENARKNINREYNKAKINLVRLQSESADVAKITPVFQQVETFGNATHNLTRNYVKNNRELYDEMLQLHK